MAASVSVSDSSAALDARFMAHANDLALRGWGRTFPNPLVGAVLVRDGVEIAAGWHAEFGDAHAEAVVIAAAGEHARGATLYTTLEPCTHHGKQPPCVDAIVAAGIERVVVAATDPNPVAAGGIAALRKHGIAVDVGVLAAEVTRRNFRFFRQHASPTRPFVAIKLAVSMDGMIADAQGRSRWVSGDAARAWAHWLRAGFGAIAAGAKTVIADNAQLTVRGDVTPRVAPTRVVFDRSGVLPASHKLFGDAVPVVVVTGASVAESVRKTLQGTQAQLLVADELPVALAGLATLGVDTMLVEGGGRLAGALMREKLVDRVYQVQCPLWLGSGVPAWSGLGKPGIEAVARWHVTDASRIGGSDDFLIELEP